MDISYGSGPSHVTTFVSIHSCANRVRISNLTWYSFAGQVSGGKQPLQCASIPAQGAEERRGTGGGRGICGTARDAGHLQECDGRQPDRSTHLPAPDAE